MSPIYFRLKSLFHSRENTILGRQRLVLFESIAVLSIVLSCASYFVLPTTPLLIGMNIFSILGSIVLLLLYNIRQLTIRWSCTILYVLLQLVLSVKKVSYATSGSPLTDEMILYASFLSLLLITV